MHLPVTPKQSIELLKELIAVHHNRIAHYQHASAYAEEADLKVLFAASIEESKSIIEELEQTIQSLGGHHAVATTTSSKLLRSWIKLRSALGARTSDVVLSRSEKAEMAAKNAYTKLLEETHPPRNIKRILAAQQEVLQTAHARIKALQEASRQYE